MSKKKTKEILEGILIEQVAAEGKSLAHVDGKVLFVPQTIPGDIVDVQLTRKRTGYMEGYVVKMQKPSPDRIEPFCTHYGVCGGCKWQPLPYPLQLKFKQQQVLDQLTRIGKLVLPPVVENYPEDSTAEFYGTFPILGAFHTTEYRNKLEYTFTDRRWIFDGENPEELFSPSTQLDPADFPDNKFPPHLKNGYSNINTNPKGFGLGFHIVGCFDKVLDIQKCFLQPEPSNEIRNFIRQYAIDNHLPFFNLREQTGFLRDLIIRNNRKGDVMLIVMFSSVKPPYTFSEPQNELITKMLSDIQKQFPQIKSLNYLINNKLNDAIGDLEIHNFSGEDAIYEEMEGLNFKIGPKSFYQTNTEQAYRLYCVVRDFAQLRGDETIYDLYTGTGTIALFLARSAKNVIGIEYVPEAIEDAKVNARNNGIENCEFFAGDMKNVLTADFIRQHSIAKSSQKENPHPVSASGSNSLLPVSDSTEQLPTSDSTEQLPTSDSTEQLPTSDSTDLLALSDSIALPNSDYSSAPDLIVLDPPRAGIHPDVAQVILEACPAKIVYVSCNPATQARDLAIFAEKYEITAVRPVDMFPHTHHVENVVALRRK